jgi:DNA-binding MarR family transcriptional regulator
VIKENTIHIAEYSQILSQIINELFENTFLKDYGPATLSKTQFSTLRILSAAGTHAVSEIADILHISRAAASKNVEKLVRQKLVDRKVVKEDRRIVQVSLTVAGETLVNAYEQMSLKKQDEALSKFSENERIIFSDLLGKYVRNCLHNESNVEAICMQCKGNLGEDCTLGEFNENCRHFLKTS